MEVIIFVTMIRFNIGSNINCYSDKGSKGGLSIKLDSLRTEVNGEPNHYKLNQLHFDW